ncbi:5'-3' exoribonuclease 1 [Acipenser ruthenus]|uniref:5'-3' exoribonuclease 1 n=1 Tax=Acipenser ruthenus TaxID=7906 RepID=A0A444UNV9_ACIRT|nr:5'-3' exoribonuclease 1 [Acipenser ruthenus]
MGVPKFYRWISERYPCLSEVVKEHQIPEFDNLYLDMNGIIHQCSHPNDEDVHFRISEEKIFADIFHYLEVLFRIIKPMKVFFMAVDGVAPRAKMNQQRGRRFRSAKEAEDKIKKALEKGETLPTEARFDSNCITPGTGFMARLQEQLKYFVNSKISTDKSWQGVHVYLSGHETPGEGEHKIMEFIRSEKAKPDHDPNTRHCLYGLDADLIMLGLTSHEPHFCLLREEVRFGGKKSQKRITAPEETTFHLLHLSLMREYIDYEFSAVRGKISFEYDLERIIDDWILMGFLVGNDFIPHLPHFHINHDALPLLYRTYISVLPKLEGYINDNGNLNLVNFEKYLEKLSEYDREHFNEVFVDLKWFESKVGNKYLNEAAGTAAEEERNRNRKQKVDSLCLAALDGNKEVDGAPTKDFPDDDHEDEDLFETEFRQYKRSYYMTKMGVEVVSDEFLAGQAECYVLAIQWILHYYYHGVQSWSWYYPYHYAPYLSDIRNFSKMKLLFDMGKPFLPFEQLLGVLPAASKDLLPKGYQDLMISEDSPIIEYYPLDFKTDLNGKQQEWEAVVLIPFIDEKRLLAAMEPNSKLLTMDEKKRNRHSECAVYFYDKDIEFLYPSPLPDKFPPLVKCHARYKTIPMDAWHVDLTYVANKVCNSDMYFCGFPTLKHIKHKFYKKKNSVQVFQQSSRGESMMLEIMPSDEDVPGCEDVASLVLGKSVFVNWPHLEEARVVAVSDGETKFFLEEPLGEQKLYTGKMVPPTKVVYLSDKEQNTWLKEVQGISEFYNRRKGIVINETAVLLFAQLLTGRKYVLNQNGEVHLEKQWSKQIIPFVYQAVVKDIVSFDSSFSHFKTIDELFSPETTVFMLGNPYYGCMGKKYSVRYNPGYVLASRLGITGYLVSRFSGSIFIGRGSKRNQHGEQKVNVGLNLKFNKKNEEVPGYTKKSGNEWLYSVAVEELLAEYVERFPEVFSYVSKNSHDDVFYEDDIWPGEEENGAERVHEITAWLKAHAVSSSSRASCDQQILDTLIVEKIEEELEKCKFYKKKNSVQVFQQSSRGESMMLEIMPSDEDVPGCEDVASLVLGKSVFVNWPHLEEARVVAVSDGETKFFLEEPLGEQKLYTGKMVPPTKVVYLSDKEQNTWLKEVQGISEFYNRRKGIVINETAVLLFAQLLTGRKYVLNQNGEVHLEKQWSKQIIPFVYQAVVKDIVSFDSSFSHFKTIDELFSPETTVFMLGNPYYGCMGKTQVSSDVIREGRIRVVFTIPCEPQLDALIQNQHKYSVRYNPGYVLASRLGITGYLVSRFSGSIFIGRGSKRNQHGEQKVNVGLNLKFNKKNEEVPGYTKKSGNEWLYSVAVEELLAEYVERFPEVFSYVSKNSHDDVFYEDDIWPGEEENGAERVHEITAWLKAHAVSSSSRASCDQQILDTLIVEKIEEELEKCKQTRSNKKVRVTVKPHLLFRPLEQHHGVIPDKDAEYHLFDRVVNVRESFSVPLGLRGTVIGIKGAEREAEVLYEVLFDKEFAGGLTIRCSPGRGYRLPPSALVNLTHGSRLENGFQKLTAIVKPQPASASEHSTYSATAQKVQIGGLNHSPRSPFVPTQSHAKEDEFSNVWQSLQGSGNPHNPPQHWQENSSGGSERQNIRVLKRNEDYNADSTAHPSGSVHTPSRKAPTEFEELIANLKISKGNEAQPAQTKEELSNEEPLSPQSFAMKGTLMLKEMLKIDSSSSVPADKDKQSSTEAAYPANTTAHHSRRRSTKKLAAHINNPHVAGAPQHGQGSETSVQHHGPPQPPVPTVVTELSRICASLGMSQPEFGYLRTPQGMTVCQVKLSSGLLVHGPQCQSENEAKEKAALFALQRLVTKKRATGKKNYETREYNNSQYVRSQKNEQAVKSEAADVAPQMTTAPPAPVASLQASLAAQEHKDKQGPSTPRQKPNPTTPGSSAKRRPRKLAVNFDAAKVSE